MKRYETRFYVTDNPKEAVRLAGIDRTRAADIKVTRNVDPVHVAGSWTLWSDGKFTPSIRGMPRGGSLSKDAVGLICDHHGSDLCSTSTMRFLSTVTKVLRKQEVVVGPSDGYWARATINRYDVETTDGSKTFYVFTKGYFEGYAHEVFESIEEARKSWNSWTGGNG